MFQCLLCSHLAIWTGFLLDLLLGDPYAFPHPVRLMGRWIGWLDGHLRVKNEMTDPVPPGEQGEAAKQTTCRTGEAAGQPHGETGKAVSRTNAENREAGKNQTLRGCFLVILVLVPSVALPLCILALAYRAHIGLGIAVESIFCYQMLAARCLEVESKKVYKALKAGDLEGARYAVSMIVGRDTDRLDEQGITRAAVETVAENTSDGEIAPLFYMFLFGAAGGFFYKAVNTMDSMVGYKNEKYRTFGTCAARLDDVLNFLPSRLAALLMIIYSYMEGSLFERSGETMRSEKENLSGTGIGTEAGERERVRISKKSPAESNTGEKKTVRISGKNAFRIWRRDRLKHASPNSAQTESACAGALGVQLAGDAWYFGKPVKKQTLGDADRQIEYEDILRAHRLMYGTSFLMMLLGTAVSAVPLLMMELSVPGI